MINLHVGQHGPHINLIATLLKLDFVLIGDPVDPSIINSWKSQYDYMINKLNIHAREYQEFALWEWYLNTQTIYNTAVTGAIDIYVEDGESLDDTVLNLMIALDAAGILPNFYKYLTTSKWNRLVITQTILQVQNRTPTIDEIECLNESNGRILSEQINYFSFLMILYFNKEGRDISLHLPFIKLFKDAKYGLILTIPTIALIMCGHSRSFFLHSNTHKVFIDNIYIDIFIHTWDTRGPRRVTGEKETTDIDLLTTTYNPSSLQIEPLNINRPEFSLLGKEELLFFKHKQEKDDASFYTNANLYSLYKASLLILQYEINKNMQYGGILKMPFDYSLDQFIFKNIYTNIDRNILWVPGTGCSRCTLEAKWPYLYSSYIRHTEHLNDIDIYWMYGKRELMLYACNLYLHAYAISESVLDENITAYVNVAAHRKFREFVYILGHDMIEKKIYEINNLPMRVWGFYPQNLFRIYMKDYMCVSTEKASIPPKACCETCASCRPFAACGAPASCAPTLYVNPKSNILGKFPRFDLDRALMW